MEEEKVTPGGVEKQREDERQRGHEAGTLVL